MNSLQSHTNNLAISLSLLCIVHCLALPLIIIVLPSLAVLHLDNEAFHMWLLIGVIPSSIYSLTMGCRQHKRKQLLLLGAIGLLILVLAALLGEAILGELFEKVFTVIGGCIIALGHYWNYRLCQQVDHCDCTEDSTLNRQ